MNRLDAYKFFNELIEKYPSDAAPMLIDIILDYLLFPKDGQSSLYAQVQQRANELAVSSKLEAVKHIKIALDCSLVEAKNLFENNFNVGRMNIVSAGKSSDFESKSAKDVINKIKVDYNLL